MSSENSSDRVMVDTGGEAFVEMMNSNGVDCLFLNSGTDTFPIQEGIAKLREQGRPTPKVILCPDLALSCSLKPRQKERPNRVYKTHPSIGAIA